jgi:hypothetical protein
VFRCCHQGHLDKRSSEIDAEQGGGRHQHPRTDSGSPIAELASLLRGREVLIDLAPTLFTNMPRWSTHPDLTIVNYARSSGRDGYFLQTLVLPEHVGCHIDAPAHCHRLMHEHTNNTFPPDCVTGPANQLDVCGRDRPRASS